MQAHTYEGEYTPSGEFMEALCDDLNTPLAISVLDSLCGKILAGDKDGSSAVGKFVAGAQMLGLFRYKPSEWFRGLLSASDHDETEAVEAMVRERSSAKRQGDFEKADLIRQELMNRGITLEDTSTGETIWRRST